MAATTATPSKADLACGKGMEPLELGAWRGFLRVHSSLMKELDADLQAEHGLSLSSFEVLLTLVGTEDGKMRMSDVADSVLLSRSGLTRLVDRLEHKGLIERHECTADRRGAHAVITEEGRRRFEAAQESHLAAVRTLFLGKLSEAELRTLTELWERLLPGSAA